MVGRVSRWVEAVPTKGPDARSAAKYLCKEVFPRFGFPDTLSIDKSIYSRDNEDSTKNVRN